MYIHPSLSPLPHYSVSTSNNNDKRTMSLEQIRPKIGRRVSWLWKLPVGNQNQRKKNWGLSEDASSYWVSQVSLVDGWKSNPDGAGELGERSC
ncbi:hypothetical protein BDV41DRAFT_537666 [Aspergillus transmontanensis]|uniref:Uncharacterized protein n=1 Tax=Aspergillus transmontanensis TaxID=1034304 RepID=A0A5N6W0M7_9EURO|nr:hypothetical protein BDV41DRAFT_537666 [Aspergillus transmontanensis]